MHTNTMKQGDKLYRADDEKLIVEVIEILSMPIKGSYLAHIKYLDSGQNGFIHIKFLKSWYSENEMMDKYYSDTLFLIDRISSSKDKNVHYPTINIKGKC